ncbi:hypothetical protein PWT90_04246 [Aphanocladium album]|nr:hypothetical protein PWT90_04246 [Aphanocladium album]
MGFVKHLLLRPDAPSDDETAHPTRRIACFQKCRALHRRQDAEPLNKAQVLRCLKFLHLENQFRTDPATAAIAENLRLSLEEQTGLEVLALKGMHCDVFESFGNSSPTNLHDEPPWPLLKALCLRTCNPLSLKQLLKFQYIQVIAIGQAEPNARRITFEAAGYIGMCRKLRAVDLENYEISGADLMNIVRGCAKLKYLRLGGILDAEGPNFAEDTFLPMIRGLPFLEFLKIWSRFRIDGAVIGEISRCCPCLAFLELPRARVDVSWTTLCRTLPLTYLRGLKLSAIWFERPKHLLQTEELKRLAMEWRRVFPKLAVIPCHGDLYWGENDSDNDEMISDEATVYQKPLLDFDDYGSSWFILRVKLWKILNYPTETFSFEKMKNMWKRQFEVEMIGWPIVPFAAFLDPNLHSTSSREYD